MPVKSRIILGVDPGFSRLGIALIKKEIKETLLHSECFETDAKEEHSNRLLAIMNRVEDVIKTWRPDILAIEKLFFNKNITTALKVAEARGVIMSLCKNYGLEVVEYNPLEIKSAVAGYGKATKQQMIAMVPKLIKIDRKIKYDDEYDAIAIALTACAIQRPKISSYN